MRLHSLDFTSASGSGCDNKWSNIIYIVYKHFIHTFNWISINYKVHFTDLLMLRRTTKSRNEGCWRWPPWGQTSPLLFCLLFFFVWLFFACELDANNIALTKYTLLPRLLFPTRSPPDRAERRVWPGEVWMRGDQQRWNPLLCPSKPLCQR